MLPLQGARVPSLVRELRSRMSWNKVKKKKRHLLGLAMESPALSLRVYFTKSLYPYFLNYVKVEAKMIEVSSVGDSAGRSLMFMG